MNKSKKLWFTLACILLLFLLSCSQEWKEIAYVDKVYGLESNYPVELKESHGLSKKECIDFCVEKACEEITPKGKWNFMYASYQPSFGDCQCTCVPYNTSKIVVVIEE